MALKYAIDTSAYSAFNRDQHGLGRFINADSEIFVPLTVIGELQAGFKSGGREQDNQLLLADFLNLPNVAILRPGEKTAENYADIYAQLRSIGKPIGANDIWIAAACLEHELPLLTLDSHFQQIEGLDLIHI